MGAMRKPHALLLSSLFAAQALGCTDSSLPKWATSTAGTDIDKTPQERDAGSTETPDASDEDAAATPIPPPAPRADVEVVITSDNAFSFGYGDAQQVQTFVEGVPSDAEGIFNCPVGFGPQPYLVPGADAPDHAYLYIISWADRDYTQGALAQFKRKGGFPIYSGNGAWEVCATGKEYEPNAGPGPDASTVNEYLSACNVGSSGDTFSKGWVSVDGAITEGARGKLAIGEANDEAGGDFPIVCQLDDEGTQGIDAEARWMWFDPEDGRSAFVGNAENRTQAFLIFRLPADILVF